MALRWDDKDPDEVLDYSLNWTKRLGDGEALLTSEWTISGPDELLVQDSDSLSSPATTIWLSAGTLNKTYTLLNRVTTSGGRTMDQSVRLKLKAK